MFLRKIFVKNTLGTIESKNHHKNKNRSDFTGWFLFKKSCIHFFNYSQIKNTTAIKHKF